MDRPATTIEEIELSPLRSHHDPDLLLREHLEQVRDAVGSIPPLSAGAPSHAPYKGQKLMGFKGTLVANVDLPDDIAIGKAVSYGWLVRA